MIEIVPGLYRGPRPKIEDLKAAYINLVICLETGCYEFFSEDDYEDYDFFASGITYMEIPCSNICPPNALDVARIIKTIKRGLSDGLCIYLHCLHGEDRTGFVAAVFRMQECGWTYEHALQEWKLHGRKWYYKLWEKELRKWS